ncbi:MAG TPA: tRNA pseudouridine(13) synthase TruD, partial [Candidatus Methanomethylia archaeon]|nr:tRNA pseudouridine(13) synthase TruD [Candidatus Methanomethylicia archaeon]
YQAFLFNKILSARIEEQDLPLAPLPGDKVAMLTSWGSPARIVDASPSNLLKLQKLIESGKAALALPVPGSMKPSPLSSPPARLMAAVLEEEQISLRHFKDFFPSLKGGWRICVVKPKEFRVEVRKDPLTRSLAAHLGFFLPSGSYATMLLRELVKPLNPFLAGL